MKCKANGCPLDVDFVTNWHDDGEKKGLPKWGVCRYHRNAQPERWAVTTDRIKSNALGVAGVRVFRRMEREPILQPAPGETARAWIDRIENQIRDLINGRQTDVDADEAFRKVISLLSG